MHAPHPEPAEPEAETLRFADEAEFRAWAQENVGDWEQFVADAAASRAEIEAWRAAGNPGFPPGSILLRDYLRAHPL